MSQIGLYLSSSDKCFPLEGKSHFSAGQRYRKSVLANSLIKNNSQDITSAHQKLRDKLVARTLPTYFSLSGVELIWWVSRPRHKGPKSDLKAERHFETVVHTCVVESTSNTNTGDCSRVSSEGSSQKKAQYEVHNEENARLWLLQSTGRAKLAFPLPPL